MSKGGRFELFAGWDCSGAASVTIGGLSCTTIAEELRNGNSRSRYEIPAIVSAKCAIQAEINYDSVISLKYEGNEGMPNVRSTARLNPSHRPIPMTSKTLAFLVVVIAAAPSSEAGVGRPGERRTCKKQSRVTWRVPIGDQQRNVPMENYDLAFVKLEPSRQESQTPKRSKRPKSEESERGRPSGEGRA